MKKPVADPEQDAAVALRAAAYVQWVKLRENRFPRDEERHDWIRGTPTSDGLRSLDSGVIRIDRVAVVLDADGVGRGATEHAYFEALDKLRGGLDGIKGMASRLGSGQRH